MFNALFALIGFVVEVLVTAVKKLFVWAFLGFLLTVTTIVTLVIILDHTVG